MPTIVLLTDFGTRDHYVASVKGVIAGLAPNVPVVDATHDIEPHNVLHAAFVLMQTWRWFPPGTIFLAVVDPGVGSDRRIILGQYGGRFVVAPDNGLVTLLHRQESPEAVYVVENRRFFLPETSRTFQARDIMAPVAAHLANGEKPAAMGPLTDRLEMLAIPHRAKMLEDGLQGIVLYVDRFGTLITNIHADQLETMRTAEGAWEVQVNGTPISRFADTFSDVDVGETLAMIGSSGLLEIAVNQGSAAKRFGNGGDVEVRVRFQ